MGGLGFLASSKGCFQGRVNLSRFLTSHAWAGRATYTQRWGMFGFLAENWLRGCLGWQKKGGEWVGCIFGFQLHSEVLPCVPLYKYSSSSVFCINSWNTFIYLHLQFQKIDHSWVVSSNNSVSRRINFVKISSEAVIISGVVKHIQLLTERKSRHVCRMDDIF